MPAPCVPWANCRIAHAPRSAPKGQTIFSQPSMVCRLTPSHLPRKCPGMARLVASLLGYLCTGLWRDHPTEGRIVPSPSRSPDCPIACPYRKRRSRHGAAALAAIRGVVALSLTMAAAPPSPLGSTNDLLRLRPSELPHAIEHVARDGGLRYLSGQRPHSEPPADHGLVAEGRVLDSRLPVVARLLLPSAASELRHSTPRPVARLEPSLSY